MRTPTPRLLGIAAALVVLAFVTPGADAGAASWKVTPLPYLGWTLSDRGDAVTLSAAFTANPAQVIAADGSVHSFPAGWSYAGMRGDGWMLFYRVRFSRPEVVRPDVADYQWMTPTGALVPFALPQWPIPGHAPQTQPWVPVAVARSGWIAWRMHDAPFNPSILGVTAPGAAAVVEVAREADDPLRGDLGFQVTLRALDERGGMVYRREHSFTSGAGVDELGFRDLTAPAGCLVALGGAGVAVSATAGVTTCPIGGPPATATRMQVGATALAWPGDVWNVRVGPQGWVTAFARWPFPGVPAGTWRPILIREGRVLDLAAQVDTSVIGARFQVQAVAEDSFLVWYPDATAENVYKQASALVSRRARFTGQVVDGAGAPVARVTVTATRAPATTAPLRAAAAAPERVAARSGANGAYAMDLRPGSWLVSVPGACLGSGACAATRRVEVDFDAGVAPLRVRVDAARPIAPARTGRVVLRVRRGATTLRLRCRRVTGPCAVAVRVGTAHRPLAEGGGRIAAGALAGVRVVLTKRGAARLARGAFDGTATVTAGAVTVRVPVRVRR